MPADPRRASHLEARRALAVSAVVVALFVADAKWRGAVGVARNDDWSYLRTAFDFADSGRFELNGWASTNLVGQVVVAWPVVALAGRAIAPLQLATAAVGVLSLWVWYLLGRRVLPPAYAALACAALAVGPLFGTLTVSFMSDVPALFIQGLVLLCGARCLEGPRAETLRWFCLAGALAVAGFTVREYTAAAFAAVAVIVLVRVGRSRRPADLAAHVLIVFLFAASLALIWVWRHDLPLDNPFPIRRQSLSTIQGGFAREILTLSFFAAPAALLVAPRRLLAQSSRLSRLFVVAACAFPATLLAANWHRTFLGNYFSPDGSYTVVVHGGPTVLVSPVLWHAFAVVAGWSLAIHLIAGGTAARDLYERRRQSPGTLIDWLVQSPLCLLGCFVGTTLAMLLAAMATTGGAFDRYVLPVVPAAAIVVLALSQRSDLLQRGRAAWAGMAALGLYAIVGLGFVDAAAAFDGARWSLGQDAVAEGTPAATVNAGFEWYGFYQTAPVTYRPPVAGETWWEAFFPGPICRTVTTQPADAPVLDERIARSLFGSTHLYLVAGPAECGAP